MFSISRVSTLQDSREWRVSSRIQGKAAYQIKENKDKKDTFWRHIKKKYKYCRNSYLFEHITVVCYCSTTSLDNVEVNAPNHLSYRLHCSNLCVFNAMHRPFCWICVRRVIFELLKLELLNYFVIIPVKQIRL